MYNTVKRIIAVLLIAATLTALLCGCSGTQGADSGSGKGQTVNKAYIIEEKDFEKYRAEFAASERDGRYTVPAVTELTAGNTYYVVASTSGETKDGSAITFKEDSKLSFESSDGKVSIDGLIDVLNEGEIGRDGVTVRISKPEKKDGKYTYGISAESKSSKAEFSVFVRFMAKTEGKLSVNYSVRGSAKKNEYAPLKSAEVDANVYFTNKVELNDVNISFLAEEDYVDGEYEDVALSDSVVMNVGKTYYMVVSAKMLSLIEGENNERATLNVKVSPFTVLDGSIEEAGTGNISETVSGNNRNISAKISMPETYNENKSYTFIIKLTAASTGKASVSISFTANGISIVGGEKIEKTFYVGSEEAVSTGFEYALSDDESYYILVGPGSVTAGVCKVPAEYNGLPVKKVAPVAFSGEKTLKKIEIANSVIEIGDGAFQGCTGLETAIFPRGAAVGKNVFEGCSSIKKITLGLGGSPLNEKFGDAPESIPSTLKEVEIVGDDLLCEKAFEGGGGIEKISLPASLKTVGDNAFYEMKALSELTVSADNADIFSECGILYKKGSTEILGYVSVFPSEMTYPNGVTLLPGGDMSRVTHITVPSTATGVIGDMKNFEPKDATGPAFIFEHMFLDRLVTAKVVGGTVAPCFSGAKKLTSVTVSEGVTELPKNFLRGCTELTSYNVPNGITSIPEGAFAYCEKLSRVTFSDSVEEIGAYAFEDCFALSAVVIPNSVTVLGNGVFDGCVRLASVSLSENITEIGAGAFRNCESLRTVKIPKATSVVSKTAFEGCKSLISVTVSDGNTSFCSENGILYNFAGTKLYVVPSGTNGKLELLDTLVAIGRDALEGCKGITEIVIPQSVLCIEANAFEDCSALSSITFNGRSDFATYDGIGNEMSSVVVSDPVTNVRYMRDLYKDRYFGNPMYLN